MAEFSTAAELDVVITEQSLREARGTIEAELGEFDVAGAVGGGAGAGGASVADVDTRLEESNRLAQTRNDLLRELLEGAGGAGGSGGGASGSGSIGGLRGATRLLPAALSTGGAATGGGLLGSLGVTAGGTAAAGLAIPGIALAGILSDDSNANPGGLQTSPTDTNVTTPNATVSRELERLLTEGLNLNRPEWLGGDGTINVQQRLVGDPSGEPTGPGGGVNLDAGFPDVNFDTGIELGPRIGGEPAGPGGGVNLNAGFPNVSTGPGNEAADRRRSNSGPGPQVDVSAEIVVDSLVDVGREVEEFVNKKIGEIEDGFQ